MLRRSCTGTRGVSCRDSALNEALNSFRPTSLEILVQLMTTAGPPENAFRALSLPVITLYIPPLQHPHPSLWLILTHFQLLRPPRIYLCPISSAPYPSNSPKGNSSTVWTATKHGKGHLDKILPHGNSTPDKCTDPKWLLAPMEIVLGP